MCDSPAQKRRASKWCAEHDAVLAQMYSEDGLAHPNASNAKTCKRLATKLHHDRRFRSLFEGKTAKQVACSISVRYKTQLSDKVSGRDTSEITAEEKCLIRELVKQRRFQSNRGEKPIILWGKMAKEYFPTRSRMHISAWFHMNAVVNRRSTGSPRSSSSGIHTCGGNSPRQQSQGRMQRGTTMHTQEGWAPPLKRHKPNEQPSDDSEDDAMTEETSSHSDGDVNSGSGGGGVPRHACELFTSDRVDQVKREMVDERDCCLDAPRNQVYQRPALPPSLLSPYAVTAQCKELAGILLNLAGP